MMPYVEKNYRVLADRAHRAIAGLSMGGCADAEHRHPAPRQVRLRRRLQLWRLRHVPPAGRGAARPAAPPPPPGPSWKKQHLAALDNAALKKGLKVFWFSTGSEDGLIPTTQGAPSRCSRSTGSSRCSRRARAATRG